MAESLIRKRLLDNRSPNSGGEGGGLEMITAEVKVVPLFPESILISIVVYYAS